MVSRRITQIALFSTTLLLFGATAATAQKIKNPPEVSPPLANANCDGGADGIVKTYLSVDNVFGDTRADASGRIRLRGWLHTPPGPTPPGGFPVLIFNHGSNQESSDRCVLADFFSAKRGYMLFVPVRRGHSGSTGEYFEDYALRRVAETCAMSPCSEADEKFWKRYFTMNYLADQTDDVIAAIRYIQSSSRLGANVDRIGVFGQSFGGMVTLLFNERANVEDGEPSLNVRASVAISPGAQSWTDVNNPADYLQQRLRNAVRNAQRPLYFLQPKNDKSILPTIELSYEAGYAGLRYQATMFGPVPDELIQPCIPESEAAPGETTCGDVAHGKFIRDAGQVAIWGPPVVQFFARMGVRPEESGSKSATVP